VEGVISNIVETAGYKTHLHRQGEGNEEAILFLHGSGPGANAWSNWQYALPLLGDRYDCLAPDLIGFSKSEHPDNPPEGMGPWMDIWVEQQIALLDALGHEKAHLVGNSMGGAISLHLMDRYPDRVERMVLLGTAGVPWRISEQLDSIWGFYEDPTPEHMKQVVDWFAYDPARVGGDLDGIARVRFEAAMKPDVRRSYSAMFPAPRQQHIDDLTLPEESYRKMDRPTLLIHGRDDDIVPLEASLYLLERLPDVQLHVFGRCSHWTQIEYRDSFNRLLEDFFGGEI